MAPGVAVFAVTYVLISARRFHKTLDRPAAALMGAVACVASGALSPDEALRAIDPNTIALLFGVMGMGSFLAADGFFDEIESRLVRVAATPSALMALVVWGAGILSAFVTNDAVCVLGAPLVARLIRKYALPPVPFLLALCTGANTGSVATLVGNPQNMLCGILGDLSYGEFARHMVPIAVVGLILNHGILHLYFSRALRHRVLPPAPVGPPIARRNWLTLGLIASTAVCYSLGASLAWTSVGGFVLLLLVHRKPASELWPRIDWPLLSFFSALFVVVAGLTASGAPAAFFARYPVAALTRDAEGWALLSGVFLLGSNLVSNVPFILVVQQQMDTIAESRTAWELLAMASTFAGNLTLLGSVANIIVAESARESGGLGFREHFRVGAPLALLTTAIGSVMLLYPW